MMISYENFTHTIVMLSRRDVECSNLITSVLISYMKSCSNLPIHIHVLWSQTGIDQLLFFTKGTYIQRYVIMTGITAFFQIIACALGIFALDKVINSCFTPLFVWKWFRTKSGWSSPALCFDFIFKERVPTW